MARADIFVWMRKCSKPETFGTQMVFLRYIMHRFWGFSALEMLVSSLLKPRNLKNKMVTHFAFVVDTACWLLNLYMF